MQLLIFRDAGNIFFKGGRINLKKCVKISENLLFN
jgi:hypothetical protein